MNLHEAIAQLTAELDAETVAELIAQFLSDTPRQIAALRAAAERPDLPVLGRTAHSIAGSSSTFGLDAIRAAALALEETALAGERTKISSQIEALVAAYESAVPALQRVIQP